MPLCHVCCWCSTSLLGRWCMNDHFSTGLSISNWPSTQFSLRSWCDIVASTPTIESSRWLSIKIITSSTAQGGGGSFKNRKPIGEVGCCESGMAKRIHWWIERCLISLTLSLSFSAYLPTYLLTYLPIYLLSIYLSIDLSISLSFFI